MKQLLMKEIAAVLAASPLPLHYKEIAKRVIMRGAWKTRGATPLVTMRARLSDAIRDEDCSTFVRISPGVYGLSSARYKITTPEPERRSEPVEILIAEIRACGWAHRSRAEISSWFGKSSWCMTVREALRSALRDLNSPGALLVFRTVDDTIVICRADGRAMEV